METDSRRGPGPWREWGDETEELWIRTQETMSLVREGLRDRKKLAGGLGE